MAAITLLAEQIRPLNGATIRRLTAGAALNVGDVVYIDTDATVKPAIATSEAAAQARGIVVGVGVAGATSATSGGAVDVVTHGAVAVGAALTVGAPVYVSATAGKTDHTAPATTGQFPFVVGWAEAAQTLYINPQVIVPTANS